MPPTVVSSGTGRAVIRDINSIGSKRADPEIQMNPYNVNEILFLMQCRGVQQFHIEFSDHGGELEYPIFQAHGAPITIDA